MSASIRTWFAIGLAFTTAGAFLPWQEEGDFLYYRTFGIRVFPSFEDNGGILILLLVISLAFLFFRPPISIEKQEKWIMVLCMVLIVDSIFHIASWIINFLTKIGRVGAPSIQIGLIMVFIGSVILLITSLLHYKKFPQ